MFELVKIIFVLSMLSYASVSDIKTHKVKNLLWLIFGVIGAAFFAAELVHLHLEKNYGLLILSSCIVGFTVLSFYLLYTLHCIGGADAKVMMVLSLFFPHFFGNALFLWLVFVLTFICALPIALYFLHKRDTTRYIPFMPFLMFGFLIAIYASSYIA
jgi:Flp pilus assembly protein protease CpaA